MLVGVATKLAAEADVLVAEEELNASFGRGGLVLVSILSSLPVSMLRPNRLLPLPPVPVGDVDDTVDEEVGEGKLASKCAPATWRSGWECRGGDPSRLSCTFDEVGDARDAGGALALEPTALAIIIGGVCGARGDTGALRRRWRRGGVPDALANRGTHVSTTPSSRGELRRRDDGRSFRSAVNDDERARPRVRDCGGGLVRSLPGATSSIAAFVCHCGGGLIRSLRGVAPSLLLARTSRCGGGLIRSTPGWTDEDTDDGVPLPLLAIVVVGVGDVVVSDP